MESVNYINIKLDVSFCPLKDMDGILHICIIK